MKNEVYRAQALITSAVRLLDALQEKYGSGGEVIELVDGLSGIQVIIETANNLIEDYIIKELDNAIQDAEAGADGHAAP